MSEMIEKCARAVYALSPNGGYVRQPNTAGGWDSVFVPDPWDEAPDRHEDCREVAAAVLDALMEPSDTMGQAGADGYWNFSMGDLISADAANAVFHAMISKAKEQGNG